MTGTNEHDTSSTKEEASLTDYRTQVKAWIASNANVIFGNYSTAHAACVVEEFAKSAKESIVLMSGAFSREFYGNDVFNAFVDASKRGVSIRIITSDDTKAVDIDNLHALRDACAKGKVTFFVARYSGKESPTHFMVVDKKRYRLERGTHTPAEDPPLVQAEVCCNGVVRASKLEAFFNLVWARLEVQSSKKNVNPASTSR